MTLEFIKLKEVKHSGTGDNATHIKVMKEFENDFEDAKRYCNLRGWKTTLSNNILSVTGSLPFSFQLVALVRVNQ